jgi:glycosyltransferase involved in cell wall biosynthesis
MMRVAVILESRLHSGGGYKQEMSVARLLNKHQGEGKEFVFYTADRNNLSDLRSCGIPAVYFRKYSFSNLMCLLFQGWIARKIFHSLRVTVSSFERTLLNDGIDIVYFLKPSFLSLVLSRMNYLITIWDLCHGDHPEFSEVRAGGEYEYREFFYKNALRKAAAVLVDSDISRLNVVRRYGCDIERVYTANFFPVLDPVSDTDVKTKYSIRRPYIFYPAQFWAHKNHIYILDGLKCLQTQFGVDVDAVFSGSDKGNRDYVLNYARQIGLADRVHDVGFVPEKELAAFYKQALALVMPTYFGPTNIPPLEAFMMGCPVCYSDLPGLREQVKDAAFLMDLNDPEVLARHLMTILNDPAAVQEKVRRGHQLLSEWTEDDYWDVVKQIFDQYFQKMTCWKNVERIKIKSAE